MKSSANFLLLITAAIWGFAFVAQQVGMDYVGPFTFNGVRFILGSLSLLPLIWYMSRRAQANGQPQIPFKTSARYGCLAGCVLFAGASLQQIGLQSTTAGKAAFITGLYIVLVPIAGIFFRQRNTLATWLSTLLALSGLYLLCVKEDFSISYGDLLELIGAFFWTSHILLIDYASPKINALHLALSQFITCAFFSLLTAAWLEPISLSALLQASVPLLYGGVGSVGIAYTLQIIAQQHASPTHASIILSMETVFAAIGGYLFLQEMLGTKELTGCVLMLAGMLLCQLSQTQNTTATPEKTA